MKKLIALIIFLISVVHAQQGQWEVVGYMPRPVAGGKTFVDNDNIYVLGGYSDSTQSYVDWIQKYSTFLYIWKLNVFMNEARFGLVASPIDDTVYFYGGVHSIDTSSSSIQSWGVGLLPQIVDQHNYFKRIFSTGLIYHNNFYIIGGNSYLSSVPVQPYIVEYNLVTLQFTFEFFSGAMEDDLPEQQMSASYNNDIIIFGGVTNGISKEIHKFNVITHTLNESISELNIPRAAGEALYFEPADQIYIMGGYNEIFNAMNSVEILIIDNTSYSIIQGPEMNYSRTNFMSAVVDDAIYVLGGFNEYGEMVRAIEKLIPPVTSIKNENQTTIDGFQLFQNYPNPTNPTTKIKYRIPLSTPLLKGKNDAGGFITLKVYDALGREVAVLVNEKKSAGNYEVEFDASSIEGGLPSGIYLYQLRDGNFTDTKKMVIIK